MLHNETQSELTYHGPAHFTDAVHGELGGPNIQGAAANATGQNRTNGGAAQHVIANGELLCRNASLVRQLPAHHHGHITFHLHTGGVASLFR